MSSLPRLFRDCIGSPRRAWHGDKTEEPHSAVAQETVCRLLLQRFCKFSLHKGLYHEMV